MNLVLLSVDLLVFSRVDGVAAKLKVLLRRMDSLESIQRAWEEFSADLIVVDLGAVGIDVEAVVRWVRSLEKPVAVIAFGPHVHVQKLNQAKQFGCDQVYVRGDFLSRLESIIAHNMPTRTKDQTG